VGRLGDWWWMAFAGCRLIVAFDLAFFNPLFRQKLLGIAHTPDISHTAAHDTQKVTVGVL